MPGQWIDIPLNAEEAYKGYLCLPPSGSGPAIVLIHDESGLDEPMRKTAESFAKEGYLVLAPDLLERRKRLAQGTKHPEVAAEIMDLGSRHNSHMSVLDICRAIQVLMQRPEFKPLRALSLHEITKQSGSKPAVALLGFGPGGMIAFRVATSWSIQAAVIFDGLGYEGLESLHVSRNYVCPVAFHCGERDAKTPDEPVQQVMKVCGNWPDLSIYRYPSAGCGFFHPGRESYDSSSASIARSRTIELLRRMMGPRYDLEALWEKHCEYEFETRDVDATMATMVPEPYVNHIPTMTGGVGYRDLYRFYKYHFIATLPKDTRIVPISRTVGSDRLVDELLFCCTHDTEIDFLLPGVAPTGKRLEIPMVAIVCFQGEKIVHEHIYWDQATALVQIGRIEPNGLPIAGVETARKLVDETLPSNTLMERWKASEPGSPE